MPCWVSFRASPLSSSAQSSGPVLSIVWFSSSLVSSVLTVPPLGHVAPRSSPFSELWRFSPRKALQIWVSV